MLEPKHYEGGIWIERTSEKKTLVHDSHHEGRKKSDIKPTPTKQGLSENGGSMIIENTSSPQNF